MGMYYKRGMDVQELVSAIINKKKQIHSICISCTDLFIGSKNQDTCNKCVDQFVNLSKFSAAKIKLKSAIRKCPQCHVVFKNKHRIFCTQECKDDAELS